MPVCQLLMLVELVSMAVWELLLSPGEEYDGYFCVIWFVISSECSAHKYQFFLSLIMKLRTGDYKPTTVV